MFLIQDCLFLSILDKPILLRFYRLVLVMKNDSFYVMRSQIVSYSLIHSIAVCNNNSHTSSCEDNDHYELA